MLRTRLNGFQSLLHINEKAGRFGGTEEYIDSLTEICSNRGIKSWLIYGKKHGQFHPDLFSFNIPELVNPNIEKDFSKKIMDVVDRIQPDVVFVHNIFDSRIMDALGESDRRYALLWYIHDHYPTCLTELRSTKLEEDFVCREVLSSNCLHQIRRGTCIRRYADRTYTASDLHPREKLLHSAQFTDTVIVISEYMKAILVKNLPRINYKIKVLPRQVRQTDSLSVHDSNEKLHLGYVGRIAYEKGLHIALQALLLLPDKLKLNFSIAGVIENQEFWKRCSELFQEINKAKPNIHIEYLGLLSYEETDALYEKMDVVIIPSIWGEPFCAVGAEALVHGVGIIASNVGGIDVYIRHGETGILVKPNSPESIAAAVEMLAKDKSLLSDLVSKGHKLISTQFTAQKHFNALDKIIRGISQQMSGKRE